MPASTYNIIYNDPDCIKLQPSKKKGIQTYTKQKIPVIGSCELFVLHSDDQCFHKVKFYRFNSIDSIDQTATQDVKGLQRNHKYVLFPAM